jgi:hypothetical protein
MSATTSAAAAAAASSTISASTSAHGGHIGGGGKRIKINGASHYRNRVSELGDKLLVAGLEYDETGIPTPFSAHTVTQRVWKGILIPAFDQCDEYFQGAIDPLLSLIGEYALGPWITPVWNMDPYYNIYHNLVLFKEFLIARETLDTNPVIHLMFELQRSESYSTNTVGIEFNFHCSDPNSLEFSEWKNVYCVTSNDHVIKDLSRDSIGGVHDYAPTRRTHFHMNQNEFVHIWIINDRTHSISTTSPSPSASSSASSAAAAAAAAVGDANILHRRRRREDDRRRMVIIAQSTNGVVDRHHMEIDPLDDLTVYSLQKSSNRFAVLSVIQQNKTEKIKSEDSIEDSYPPCRVCPREAEPEWAAPFGHSTGFPDGISPDSQTSFSPNSPSYE